METGLQACIYLSDLPGRLLQLRPDVLLVLRQASPAGHGGRPGKGLALPEEHVQPHPVLPGGRCALPGSCRRTWTSCTLPASVRVSDAHTQIGQV